MNKYLKMANSRQNKRVSKLNTIYFNIVESVDKIKAIERDDLSKGFMKLSRQLQKFITIDSVVDYIKTGKPIINYNTLNNLLKAEDKKIGIIVFDTETTGLIKKSSEKNIRNQIYEMAAITYDYSMNESKDGDRVDFFHSKVDDANLNASNSILKLTQKLKEKIKSSDFDKDMEKLQLAYAKAAEKEKFNPNVEIFKNEVPDIYKPYAYDLIKMLKIKGLREMTKADKKQFFDFWTNKEYEVRMHNSEIAMVTAFFNYIERQESKFDKVYMIAHNLSFDKDIVIGSIEDAVKYWQKDNKNPEMLAKSQLLLIKANSLFDSMNSSDTLNGFKTLFNEKKYIDKIDLLVKELKVYAKKRNIPKGEKGFVSKLLILLTKIPKTKDPNFRTTSLGQVAPLGINKDWHTAVNDVFVTVHTTKMYFTMPMIISILISISENYEKNKTIISFPSIKIPTVLIKFAIRTKFHHAYKKVKDKIESAGITTVPFWAKNTEIDKTQKENPKQIYRFNPDFPENDDIKVTKAETGKDGKDLIADLQIQKDFKMMNDIVSAHKKGQMNQLTKEMNNRGVNISEKELQNISRHGLPKIENLYDILKTKGFALEEEYLKAKKMKQGAKYLADKIKKKFDMDVDKEHIVEILKQLGVKK